MLLQPFIAVWLVFGGGGTALFGSLAANSVPKLDTTRSVCLVVFISLFVVKYFVHFLKDQWTAKITMGIDTSLIILVFVICNQVFP